MGSHRYTPCTFKELEAVCLVFKMAKKRPIGQGKGPIGGIERILRVLITKFRIFSHFFNFWILLLQNEKLHAKKQLWLLQG